MINPITKIQTDDGPVILDVAELIFVCHVTDGLQVITRGGDEILLCIDDEAKRNEIVDDIYAKLRKIREENLNVLASFGLEGE